jgi:hypothetical protein
MDRSADGQSGPGIEDEAAGGVDRPKLGTSYSPPISCAVRRIVSSRNARGTTDSYRIVCDIAVRALAHFGLSAGPASR